MVRRNRFTWAYYDYLLNSVALAGLDNDKLNFQEKIAECRTNGEEVESYTKDDFDRFVEGISRLNYLLKDYSNEDEANAKQLLKKIIDVKVNQIKLDIEVLEMELFEKL